VNATPRRIHRPLAPRLLPCVPLLLVCLLAGACTYTDEDLSLPEWGPYGTDQIGPVCILDRERGRTAGFPIVVGQGNGSAETRNLVYHRNAFGDLPGRLGTWKVPGWKANRELTYWSYRVLFRDTRSMDWTVPNLPGWDRGEALVECARVPDGVLVAVTFENRDPAESHRYFADVLGGFDPDAQTLDPAGARVAKNVDEGWMALGHPAVEDVFAVRGRGAQVRLFDIRDAYFVPGASTGTDGFGGHDHGTFSGEAAGWWLDLNLAQIQVGPGESRTVHAAIARKPGEAAAAAAAAAMLDTAEEDLARARLAYEGTRYEVRHPAYRDLMEHAVGQILINTVYYGRDLGETPYAPLRQRFFIPSRYYGVFHHWDTGCISLGLLEYDPLLAAENLDTALPDQSPNFRAEGLPPNPPTTIFALWEHYQKTGDLGTLRYFYPAARQWYLYGLEQARRGDDDWLLDWQGEGPQGQPDLYGMGSGMDNFPVWEYAKIAGPGRTLRHVEAPCIQSLFLRAAKLLRMAARAVGADASHVAEYSEHIERLRAALQARMWSAQKGIFVPVWQDDKTPLPDYTDTVIGVYPLLAGRDVLTPYQKDRVIAYMTDPETLWSGFGLRTVSRSAPYYIPYVGWWGAVWTPCQWMVWKGLLSFGEVDLARDLAWQVLENFRANHEERPYLIEAAHGDTGETNAVKDFTGLGSPVIALYAAYNTPGRVTTGWDVQVHAHAYDTESDALAFRASAPDTPGTSGVVAVMGAPDTPYAVTAGGEPFSCVSDATGAVSFSTGIGFDPMEVRIERSSTR